jgi:hypothetical protein
MKVLALDVSTKTGWAVFDGEYVISGHPQLDDYGLIKNPKKIQEYGEYPWSYKDAANDLVDGIIKLVREKKPMTICVEETNGSRARYTQKILEFLHCTLLEKLRTTYDGTYNPKIVYINSSEWRKTLGLVLSKEDKKANKKLKVAKKLSAETGKKLNRTELGIRGIVNKKHIAIRYVNDTYCKNFLVKDNDICDAICLGTAYLKGCSICDGK